MIDKYNLNNNLSKNCSNIFKISNIILLQVTICVFFIFNFLRYKNSKKLFDVHPYYRSYIIGKVIDIMHSKFIRYIFQMLSKIIIFIHNNMTQQSKGMLIKQQIDAILNHYEGLQFEDRQRFKQFLLKANVETWSKRQILKYESEYDDSGLLILSGTVSLIKKIIIPPENKLKGTMNRQRKIVIAQVSFPQIVNIQCVLQEENPLAKYTSIVNSSSLKAVTIPKRLLLTIFKLIEIPVRQLENQRDKKINMLKKQQSVAKAQQQNAQIIDKMTLPELKRPQKSFSTPRMGNTKQFLRLQKKGYPSLQLSTPYQNLKAPPQQILNKMRSFKSIQLPKKKNAQKPEELEQHQRIFRDKLKTIIKRKIVYERKQLTVLKPYKNEPDVKIVEESNPRLDQGGQIDKYFQY